MVVVVHHVLSARQGRLLGDLTEVLHLHAEPVRRIQRQWHAGLIKYAAADEALAPLRLRDPREVRAQGFEHGAPRAGRKDRKSTRLNSSHVKSSYAVFCLKKKISN